MQENQPLSPLPEAEPKVVDTPKTITPETPVVPVKNNKVILKIVAALALVLLGTGGVLAYQKFSTPKPVAVSSPTPTANPDPTADWETYADTNAEFSFRYPTNWQQSTDVGLLNDPTNSYILSIASEKTTQTLQQYMNKKCIVSGTNFCSDSKTGAISSSIQYNHPKSQYDSLDTLVLNNGKIYTISLASRNPNRSADTQTINIYNQILSTFKFTGSTISDKAPLDAAKKYLDAYVSGDWTTAKELSSDPNFDVNIAQGYGFTKYEITGSKTDTNPNSYHVYVSFTDKDGKVYDKTPHSNNPLEVLMTKDSAGQWKAVTWYFYQ